jgi:predicted ester cyclase
MLSIIISFYENLLFKINLIISRIPRYVTFLSFTFTPHSDFSYIAASGIYK